MGSTQGVTRSNYSLDQAQHNQDSLVREPKEGSLPEELEDWTLLGRLETNHQGHKIEVRERK